MINKRKQLEKLRHKIYEEEQNDVWFYPNCDGVKGYLGTRDIMFVGLNPNTTSFPSRNTDLFYGQLKANNLQNAHLTDLVKIRASNKDSESILKDKNLIKKHLKFLLKEIEITKPNLIVILGKGKKGQAIEEVLKEEFEDLNTRRITHYSAQSFNPKYKDIFIEEMKSIR